MQKVWMVTGSSSGLGKSFVKAIAEQGDFVAAAARSKEALQELENLYPGQILPIKLDVTDKEQIKRAVETVINTKGRIDGLINNAGYGYRAAVEEGQEKDVDLLFQTNFFGPVSLIKEVLPYMRGMKSGSIVNISSIAAVNTFPGSGYYGASKCALEGMSSALQKETELQISDYDSTAGLRRIENDHSHGTQCGDPDKGAKLVLEAIQSENPPFKFILGGDAWEVYRQREQMQNEEMRPWLEKSRQTTF